MDKRECSASVTFPPRKAHSVAAGGRELTLPLRVSYLLSLSPPFSFQFVSCMLLILMFFSIAMVFTPWWIGGGLMFVEIVALMALTVLPKIKEVRTTIASCRMQTPFSQPSS